MMQPCPILLTACVLGAARMAHGSNVVQEHDGLTNNTGIIEQPAGLEGSAFAASEWPIDTTTTTTTSTETFRPVWTTLSTLTIAHPVTVKRPTIHTTISSSFANHKAKRADPLETFTLHPDGSFGTVRHKHSTTTVTPTVTHTATVHTSASTSSITKNKKIIVAQSTTTVPPSTTAIRSTTITPATSPLPPTVVIPSGISQLSITTIKPRTKTKVIKVKTTTTAPAKKGVIALVPSSTTSFITPTETHFPRTYHRDMFGYECRPEQFHLGCHPFDYISKKWLWLLAVPAVLLLATIPLFIFALRHLRRRGSATQDTDEKRNTSGGASQAVVTDDGRGTVGRNAEEGRGRVAMPADQTTTQTVTSAPGGKVTTTPATTVEHVETVPQHDGSVDGRKAARVPLLMRF